MLLLALDSAGSSCNVCVWRDGVVLAQVAEPMERGQDQRMLPLILQLLQQASVSFTDIDRIAITRGPGSFTGLRIGLAAARGIGLAAEKPVIGIDRFAIYHAQLKQTGKNLLVVINSKRAELFCGFFAADGSVSAPTMMTPQEIVEFLQAHPNTTITGDADLPPLPGVVSITQSEVVTCAMLAAKADAADPAYLPRPLYIRAPDVTIKAVATAC